MQICTLDGCRVLLSLKRDSCKGGVFFVVKCLESVRGEKEEQREEEARSSYNTPYL